MASPPRDEPAATDEWVDMCDDLAALATTSTAAVGAAVETDTLFQNTDITPLCVCANQKYSRIAVGHTRGFLVFCVQQDRGETYEELASISNGNGNTLSSSAAARGAQKPSLSHLVLDPLYNTDAQTFAEVARRARVAEQGKLQMSNDRVAAAAAAKATALEPAVPISTPATAARCPTSSAGCTPLSDANSDVAEVGLPVPHTAETTSLGLFMSYACQPRTRGSAASRTTSAAASPSVSVEQASHSERSSTVDKGHEHHNKGRIQCEDRTGGTSPGAAPVTIRWDQEDGSDADQNHRTTSDSNANDALQVASLIGATSASPHLASPTSSGNSWECVSDAFLSGEDFIGFGGGGVGAIALQYDLPQLAVAGGGLTPMAQSSTAESGGCDVFLLSSGHCVQTLVMPHTVTRLFLDAQLLFVLTARELRVYTNPFERGWMRCGFALNFVMAGGVSVSALPSQVCLAASGGGDGGVRDGDSLTNSSVVCSEESGSTIASSDGIHPPCAVDYARNLVLIRNPDSDSGFCLYRYDTYHPSASTTTAAVDSTRVGADPSAPAATGTSAATVSVHIRCVATVSAAHRHRIASLDLHVGPPTITASAGPTTGAACGVSGGRSGPLLFGEGQTAYVAAASAYATRITLWGLTKSNCPRNGSGALGPCPDTFVLLREFRVQLRAPRMANLLHWGWRRDRSEGAALHRERSSLTTAASATTLRQNVHHSDLSSTLSGPTPSSLTSASSMPAAMTSTAAAKATPAASTNALTDYHVRQLQFLLGGQFLFCVRGTRMLVFSTSEESSVDAQNVCQEHPQAVSNQKSWLAVAGRLVPTVMGHRVPLSSYTQQTWASCQARLPLADRNFCPGWVVQRAREKHHSTSRLGQEPQRAAGFASGGLHRDSGRGGVSATSITASPAASTTAGGTGWLAKGWAKLSAAAANNVNTVKSGNVVSHSTSRRHHSNNSTQRQAGPVYEQTIAIGESLLIWEHDTPLAATTENYELFGPANMPADIRHRVGTAPATAIAPPAVVGESADNVASTSTYASIGAGGRVVARKVVLDCATCDGSFANFRLYTDDAQLTCSPAVPFLWK